jgi:uncharacterized membrane protein YdjX (TVP38/TMEM64 family)
MAKKKSVKDAEGTGNKMRNQIIAFVVIACVSFSGAHYYITNGPALLDYESCESAARLRVIDLPLTVVSDGFRKADKTLNVNSFTSFFSTERSVEDLAKSLMSCGEALDKTYVTGVFVTVYVLLQTFAIPGPIILSVLAGVFYENIFFGVGLVATCCTVGSSLCYMLSYFLGRLAVKKLVPGKIQMFEERINSNRENLLWYMLFLRLTPILPNWFINVASPIVKVPLSYFAIATFVGTTPANVVYYYAGKVLKDSGKFDSSKGYKTAGIMVLLALLSLLPTIFKKQLSQMEQGMGGAKASNPTGGKKQIAKSTPAVGIRRSARLRTASKRR